MNAPCADDLVLVALLNNQRDLARARDEHWYRIPLRHAPRRAVGAPWIAFYQTKVFDAQKWAINYYAAAGPWDIVTRLMILPDEPDHPRAHDRYYRITLGPLLPVPHPVVSRSGRRLTFLLTRWAQLERAWEISELLEANVLERSLWQALDTMRSMRDSEDAWLD